MAKSLGADVTLVTCELASSGPDPFDRAALEGLGVLELPRLRGKPMPRYANEYDEDGNRTQYLIEQGDVLPASAAPSTRPERFSAPVDVLLYAPAFHELPAPPMTPIPAKVTAIALQGLLRDVDAALRVFPHRAPAAQVAEWLPVVAFAFLSDEDTFNAEAFAKRASDRGPAVFLTRGHHGAQLFAGGEAHDLEALPASIVEPTGAGDCFSTAFLVRYAETGDVEDASRFALAAGALAVEGTGLAAVPTRAEIEQRLARVAA